MTKAKDVILVALLAASTTVLLPAEESLHTLTGTCSLTAAANDAEVNLRMERGRCEGNPDCGSTQTQEPLTAFSGFALSDLRRGGAHLDAVLAAAARYDF